MYYFLVLFPGIQVIMRLVLRLTGGGHLAWGVLGVCLGVHVHAHGCHTGRVDGVVVVRTASPVSGRVYITVDQGPYIGMVQ